MARVWMNHWFSTAYNIISLMRDAIPEIEMVGSNEHHYSPIMNVCDEWYQEPVLKGEQYVSFCLDFCREHDIDMFMPRREMVSISRYKDRFTSAGIKVMVDDYQYVSILNQKHNAYEFFKLHGIGVVPDYFIATTVEQFREA